MSDSNPESRSEDRPAARPGQAAAAGARVRAARGPVGILALNFGEPERPQKREVTAFLERIFRANASLEGPTGADAAARRARELAERRAPALIDEYERIGGSPLNHQAEAQAVALGQRLRERGHDARVATGMQFTAPTIAEGVTALADAGVGTLVALPVYPLCGPSTTVAALGEARAAAARVAPGVELREVTGWHRHPGYLSLRAAAIRDFTRDRGLDLADPRTRLVFSAHGTPLRYVRAGSRYVEYVKEWCRTLADTLGLPTYELGYQNHSNRGIEWTEPSIETVISRLEGAERVIVDAVSFMHEQSETLAELDLDLRSESEERGLEFHRVPVPHDADAFSDVLADLVEAALGSWSAALPEPRACACREGAAVCFNGPTAAAPPGI